MTRDGSDLMELLTEARTGDEEALSELLERLRSEVESCLASRLDSSPSASALSEELAQEVLLKTATALGECRAASRAQFRAWVRTIARRSAIDWHRRREAELDRRVGMDPTDLRPDPGAALPVDRRDPTGGPEVDTVDEAIGRPLLEAQAVLSEGTRAVIRRRVLYGDTWAQAGKAVGTTAGGARRRWQRARERLRREVCDRAEQLPEPHRPEVLRRLGVGDGG